MRKAVLVLAFVLVCTGLAQASIVSIFKSGPDINMTYTTNLAADFKTAGAANVVQVTCDDTEMSNNGAALRAVNGTATGVSATGDYAYLVKWDLSSLPAGATIVDAQIRLFANNGNNGSLWIAPILTHNWSQATATVAGPNNPASPNLTWGAASNAAFSSADLGSVTQFSGVAIPTAQPSVFDVTADLQAMLNGSRPNYGWAFVGSATFTTSTTIGNHSYFTADNADATTHPALFVEYTPAPEPVTLSLLALSGLTLPRRRA